MITISVCIGSACHIKGSYNVINEFQQIIEQEHLGEKIEIKAVFCMGDCTKAVCVTVNNGETHSVSGSTAKDFFAAQVRPLLQ